MRFTSKTLVGGVLAALLVLSASPAQAFGPQDPLVGTEQETPVTEFPENLDGEEPVEDEVPAETEDQTDVPVETDGIESTEMAIDETIGASEELATQGEAAPLTSVPTEVAVTGTVMVVPDEAEELTVEEFEAGKAPETYNGAILVATDAMGLLPVASASSQGDFVEGAQFSGVVKLPEDARNAIQEHVASEGEISQVDLAQVAQEAAGLASESASGLSVEGVATAPSESVVSGEGLGDVSVAAAVAKRSHPIDIVNIGGSYRSPVATASSLKAVAATVESYWKTQSDGAITSMPVRTNKSQPMSDRCSYVSTWNQAIWGLGYHNANDYLKSGRHLMVFANDNCSSAANGWGTIGSLHSGGATWVNLGTRQAGAAVNQVTRTTAHEIGHNLGLGHGDARQCASPHSDGPVSGGASRPTGANGCSDFEYGDVWNVMGFGFAGYGAKPLALSMEQKYMLGVTNSAMLKRVSPTGGTTQTFTLNGAGASSGLRGLQVVAPAPGGTMFVEYRNGFGQDTGMRWSDGQIYTFRGYNGQVSTGVKTTKGYSASSTYGGKRGVALSSWKSGQRQLAMRQGGSLKNLGDTARVTVTKSTAKGATATVRVQFKGFTDGGKKVTTTANVSGPLFAGKILKANLSGSWAVSWGGAPSKIKESYQWYRDGKAISGATKSSYKTVATDIGKRITVKVKPSASGYATGKGSTATSKSVVSPPFYDVLYNQKFFREIWWMKSSGISNGTTKAGKAYYEPKANVTREAMAAFIYRMEKASYKAPTKSPFVDVKPGAPFYREIAWMYKAGISTGTMKKGKRYYEPKAGVTREAMSAFMYRVEKSTYKGAAKSPFADVSKNHKFYRQISWMKKEGITTGTARNGKLYYDPKSNVTREAMAAFMFRMKP